MILFFHFIFLLTKYIVKTISKSLTSTIDTSTDDAESTCSNYEIVNQDSFTSGSKYLDGALKFFPPVYVQRYEAVSLILQEHPWKDEIKKVVDFGCSELGFFLYLKRIPGLEEILEVDIDESLLECYAVKAAPLHSDYYLSNRPTPLNVYILKGSISEYDDQLAGTDAVVAIEVIEHLESEVLQKMPHNIFHEIKPKLAIFTTPNADFNVLFPNNSGLRHPDHKFEWSRKEFYKWTKKITKAYPDYTVKFYGIGVGPDGSENLGCCTQVAVFERFKSIEEESDTLNKKGISNYKLIRKYEYPFYVDKRTTEDKLLDEVSYRLKFSINTKMYYNYDEFTSEVPLREIMDYVKELCESEEELKKILINNGYRIETKDEEDVLIYRENEPEASEIDDDSSDETNIIEPISQNDFESENWDWDCAQGDFSRRTQDKLSEEELPSFLSADSIRQADEEDYRRKKPIDGRGEGSDTIPNDTDSSDLIKTVECEAKNVTISKIPLKTGIKKQSRTVGSLVRTPSFDQFFP